MKNILAVLLLLWLPLSAAAQNAPVGKSPPVKAPTAKAQAPKTQPAKAPSTKTQAPKTSTAKPAGKPAPVAAAAKTAQTASDTPKTYPAAAIVFPGGVTMTETAFSTLPGFRPLTLDLYRTSEKSFPRPGLVFVHDGDWASGDARHSGTFGDFPGLLARLAARGYVVASVNYRLSGEAHFPAALQDVKSAIRWLRGHAEEFNIDPTRIAVWGAGAGGHLAALAGVTCGVTVLEPEGDQNSTVSDCVEAVVDWYGASDVETMAADLGKPAADKSVVGDFLGCEPALCAAGVARNASPSNYIAAMSPPFLIQHGAEDGVVSPKQSQNLYDALKAKNVPAELVLYPNVGNAFARNAAADAATNAQAVEKMEGFLDATFPKKPANSPYNPPKQRGLPY